MLTWHESARSVGGNVAYYSKKLNNLFELYRYRPIISGSSPLNSIGGLQGLVLDIRNLYRESALHLPRLRLHYPEKQIHRRL